MAEESAVELTPEEAARLASVENSADALSALIDDLSSSSRRTRQLAARVVNLLAQREPEMLVPFIEQLVDALYRPEAQTRWEVLDALTLLARATPRSAAPRTRAPSPPCSTRFPPRCACRPSASLTVWGATERRRSEKVWPLVDEAIQCYHGDLEYRDMLALLFAFAHGQIAGSVAAELAGRLQFDAENGKGSYLRVRSREIYDALVKRFKLDNPKNACAPRRAMRTTRTR